MHDTNGNHSTLLFKLLIKLTISIKYSSSWGFIHSLLKAASAADEIAFSLLAGVAAAAVAVMGFRGAPVAVVGESRSKAARRDRRI